MLLAFEADNYSAQSPAGRHILKGLLCCLPDSKVVEDLHGVIRNQSKKGANRSQTLSQMMALVTGSKVLDTRGSAIRLHK